MVSTCTDPPGCEPKRTALTWLKFAPCTVTRVPPEDVPEDAFTDDTDGRGVEACADPGANAGATSNAPTAADPTAIRDSTLGIELCMTCPLSIRSAVPAAYSKVYLLASTGALVPPAVVTRTLTAPAAWAGATAVILAPLITV